MSTTTALNASIPAGSTTPVTGPWKNLDGPQLGIELDTTGTLSGSWGIDGTNSPTALAGVNEDPCDLTSSLPLPNGAPIADAAGSPTKQFIQPGPLTIGYMRMTFTPTGGAGDATAYIKTGW